MDTGAKPKSCLAMCFVLLSIALPLVALRAKDLPPPKSDEKAAGVDEPRKEESSSSKSVRVVPPPKAPSDQTKKGLAYLANQQHDDGGWGQGGGWRIGEKGGRTEGDAATEPSDVGNTCIAMLALIRSGSSPKEGPYAKQLAKGADYLFRQIAAADNESLYVTSQRDTQLQSKIGQYVDTFLAGLVLSEIKGKMSDKSGDERLGAALDKTIGKIERHQQSDGTFAGNSGWASVLSQGLCSKALNRAKLRGFAVKPETLERDKKQAEFAFNAAKGPAIAAGAPVAGVGVGGRETIASTSRPSKSRTTSPAATGDAGVSLYSLSANASRLQDKANSDQLDAEQARKTLSDKAAPAESKRRAERTLKQIANDAQSQDGVVADILARLDDKQFLAGFGNNGGEEFLSYMNLSEMMFVQGGPEWERWDRSISENVQRVQNEDGSWSGHHCITGRTFCTATALLTLLADRAPIPVADNSKESKTDTKSTK